MMRCNEGKCKKGWTKCCIDCKDKCDEVCNFVVDLKFREEIASCPQVIIPEENAG